jgi:dTDP-4-dehydrorhamnose 3,5-epimerase
MQIKTSKKLGLKIIYPSTNFKDLRGRYIETFTKNEYRKALKKNFVEDDVCINKKNVLRGIHGDHKTWKLISCISGKCLSIIVNNDIKSRFYGKSEKFILSSENYFQILIPPKHGNCFLTLSKNAVFHYKQTNYYSGNKNQFTLNIKDPFLNIKLPNKIKLIMSKRDIKAKFIKK